MTTSTNSAIAGTFYFILLYMKTNIDKTDDKLP